MRAARGEGERQARGAYRRTTCRGFFFSFVVVFFCCCCYVLFPMRTLSRGPLNEGLLLFPRRTLQSLPLSSRVYMRLLTRGNIRRKVDESSPNPTHTHTFYIISLARVLSGLKNWCIRRNLLAALTAPLCFYRGCAAFELFIYQRERELRGEKRRVYSVLMMR